MLRKNALALLVCLTLKYNSVAKDIKILWITDDWHTLDHPRDTTLRLMQESLALGLEAYWTDASGIFLKANCVSVFARRLEKVLPNRQVNSFFFAGEEQFSLNSFVSIHLRMDPPVDQAYVALLNLLSAGIQKERVKFPSYPIPELVNPADVVLLVNSKLEGILLGTSTPKTLITSRLNMARQFGQEVKSTVMKPIGGGKCMGVELLFWDSSSIEESAQSFETATEGCRKPVVLQERLKTDVFGELRYWFADGQIVGYAKKVTSNGVWPIDVDRGGTVEPTILSESDRQLAKTIGIHLQRRGIRLAAVDSIGGYVTDFNIVSPGLICQMEIATGHNIARKVLKILYLNKTI